MLRIIVLVLSLFPALPTHAETPPNEVRQSVKNPGAVGQVVFRWFGVPLYEATLFTPSRRAFDWSTPLALQLVYARDISGKALIDATLSELDRIEGRQVDHREIGVKLTGCFRDVRDGDTYVAIADAADRIGFWLNGTRVCEFRHAGAKQRILGIWLSDDSRSARLARRLRGE